MLRSDSPRYWRGTPNSPDADDRWRPVDWSSYRGRRGAASAGPARRHRKEHSIAFIHNVPANEIPYLRRDYGRDRPERRRTGLRRVIGRRAYPDPRPRSCRQGGAREAGWPDPGPGRRAVPETVPVACPRQGPEANPRPRQGPEANPRPRQGPEANPSPRQGPEANPSPRRGPECSQGRTSRPGP